MGSNQRNVEVMVARPCMDVLLPASRLALEHKRGLAELMTG
jgi:hypothetical protein